MIETLNEYQRAAERTAGKYLELTDEALMGGALGVAGEAGEVADLVKKTVMQGHAWDAKKMKFELGDVLWHLVLLAKRCGFTLQEIAQSNIEKLAVRFPEGFTSERSVNREG